MAAQKSTEIRRRLYEVQADQAALRRRQEEFECHALAAPSTTWAEAAAEARYLILLFAETSEARKSATQRADREGARRSCPVIRLNRKEAAQRRLRRCRAPESLTTIQVFSAPRPYCVNCPDHAQGAAIGDGGYGSRAAIGAGARSISSTLR